MYGVVFFLSLIKIMVVGVHVILVTGAILLLPQTLVVVVVLGGYHNSTQDHALQGDLLKLAPQDSSDAHFPRRKAYANTYIKSYKRWYNS